MPSNLYEMGIMRHESCDRAHRWASLALDEALSDLETRLLEAHLAGCAECRGFEQRIGALTGQLRTAELVRLENPIALPKRPARFGAIRIASASAVAAAALLVFGVLSLTSNDRVQQFPNVRDTEAFDLRQARRTELVPKLRPAFTHLQMARPDRL